MAETEYKVTGAFPAYDTPPGGTVKLDDTRHDVQVNVEAGVLTPSADVPKVEPEKVACPACVEQELKRPPKFSSQDELADHYGEKHAGLVVPTLADERKVR